MITKKITYISVLITLTTFFSTYSWADNNSLCSHCNYPDIVLATAIPVASVSESSIFKQPVPPHYSFEGAYAGIHTGLAMAESKIGVNYNLDYFRGYYDATMGSNTLKSDNIMGGLTVGYNWQKGHLLYGLEGDANYLPINKKRSITYPVAYTPAYSAHFQQSTNTNWLLTIRPRIGFTNGRFLAYATGGLALTQLTNNNYYTDNSPPNFARNFASAKVSKPLLGWVAGAGLEFLVTEKLSLTAEYLYVDFPKISSNSTITGNFDHDPDNPLWLSSTFTNTANLQLNILQAGIKYYF